MSGHAFTSNSMTFTVTSSAGTGPTLETQLNGLVIADSSASSLRWTTGLGIATGTQYFALVLSGCSANPAINGQYVVTSVSSTVLSTDTTSSDFRLIR